MNKFFIFHFCLSLLSLSLHDPLWRSVWRHTTVSSFWWLPMRCPCGSGWMSSSLRQTSTVVIERLMARTPREAQCSNISRKLLLWWWRSSGAKVTPASVTGIFHYLTVSTPSWPYCHTTKRDNRRSGSNCQSNPAVNLRLLRSHVASNVFTLTSNSITYIFPIVCINDFFL